MAERLYGTLSQLTVRKLREWFWWIQLSKVSEFGLAAEERYVLDEGARGLAIPAAREEMKESDKPVILNNAAVPPEPLDPMYRVLPRAEQKLQLRAQSQPEIQDAEDSQREWSEEYFARWLATSQNGTLGPMLLTVAHAS